MRLPGEEGVCCERRARVAAQLAPIRDADIATSKHELQIREEMSEACLVSNI